MSIHDLDLRIAELEAQLKRERFRMAQALELSGAGAWEWDSATDTLWWQPQLFELYGVDPATFGGKYADFENALMPDEVKLVSEAVSEANAQRRPFYHVFTAKNGKKILGIGRMENGIMYGINVLADHVARDDCPNCKTVVGANQLNNMDFTAT